MKYHAKKHPTLAGYFALAPSPRLFLRLFAGQERAILDMRAAGRRDKLTGEYRPPDGALRVAYEVGWREKEAG